MKGKEEIEGDSKWNIGNGVKLGFSNSSHMIWII